MDFELDWQVLGIAAILWVVCLIGIWVAPMGFGNIQKAIMSLVMLPICYIIVGMKVGG